MVRVVDGFFFVYFIVVGLVCCTFFVSPFFSKSNGVTFIDEEIGEGKPKKRKSCK